ncbi:MAG: hypothetical protein ACLQVD_22740 [Capsulimonadaceae bacterium]
MSVRKIILLAFIATIALVYFVLYGLACRTGRLEVEGTNKDDLIAKSFYNGPSVSILPLPLSEFRIWYTQTNSSSPNIVVLASGDGNRLSDRPDQAGVTYVTTTGRLSLGIIAIETVTTAQSDQPGSSGSSTASVGP